MSYTYGANYRQGMRPAATQQNYGEIWWPLKSRMAKCPPMEAAYDKFLSLREKKKACKPWQLKCKYGWEQKMESAERKGKSAWKKCKVEVKRTKYAEDDAFDSGSSFDSGIMAGSPDYMQEGSTYYDQGPAQQAPAYYPPETGLATTTEDANKKLMLYGGIAAGGLLLLLLLRRK
jgi:hypothetical protein